METICSINVIIETPSYAALKNLYLTLVPCMLKRRPCQMLCKSMSHPCYARLCPRQTNFISPPLSCE